ncbi:hypothetical protein Tco_0813271, partial [Tanacetum coccineum]
GENNRANKGGKYKSPFAIDSDVENDQPATLAIVNPAPTQGEPQSSGSTSKPNPLAMVTVVHSLAEVEHAKEEPAPKRLKVMFDIPKPVPLKSMGQSLSTICLVNNSQQVFFSSSQPEHSTIHPAMSRTPPLSKIDKGKSIAMTTNDSALNVIMPLME